MGEKRPDGNIGQLLRLFIVLLTNAIFTLQQRLNDVYYSLNHLFIMRKNGFWIGSLSLMVVLAVTSCTTVKEYQKSRINDSEMRLSNRKVEKNELYAQSYREGSAGANGGKTGGGCGCN